MGPTIGPVQPMVRPPQTGGPMVGPYAIIEGTWSNLWSRPRSAKKPRPAYGGQVLDPWFDHLSGRLRALDHGLDHVRRNTATLRPDSWIGLGVGPCVQHPVQPMVSTQIILEMQLSCSWE